MKFVYGRYRQADRKQTVAKAVAMEDVAETRGNENTQAEISERPRCLLAAGARSEVFICDQNLLLHTGTDWKIWITLVSVQEGILAEPDLAGIRQEPCRVDDICIDIGFG